MGERKIVYLKHGELHHVYQALGDSELAIRIKKKLEIAMNTKCEKLRRQTNQGV